MWIVLLVGAFFGQDLYGQCSLTINPATGMLNCKSTGTAGPAGATGPTGPIGPAGATGATGAGLVNCSEAGGQMSCPAGYVSGATAAGAVVTKEASVNGTDAITVGAPDSVSASYRINYPADPPTVAGQALRAGTPGGGITQYTHAVPIWTGTSNPNGYFDWTLGAAPTNPSAGDIRLYPKTGSTLCARDSAGTETCFGSGGGGSVQRVAYASVPGTCDSSNANTLYITEILKGHCNGSSYQWYDGDDTVTLPGVLSGWTQVNSPSTATDTAGTIFLRAAAASGHSVKSILKSISGTDWTITGKWRNQMAGQANSICGLVFSAGNTSSNRVYIFGENTADGSTIGNTYVLVWDFSNYTTSTANNILSGTGYPTRAPGSTFYRVVKSGTNWSYQISRDNGQNYITLRTIAQPFTAAYAGFACSSGGDGASDGDAAITISHYLNQ